MFTSRREQLGDAGDDFLTAYGLDDSATDTTPSTIPLAQTSIGTFSETPPPVAVPGLPTSQVYATPYAPGAPYAVAASTPSPAQQVVSTTNALSSIVNSIGSLFGAKPATPAPVVINGVVQKPVAAPATAGVSLTTLLLLGAAGAAALVLANKRKGRRR